MRGPEGGNAARFTRELPSPVPPHQLDARITPERARRYRQVLARRTGRLAVVVEECYDQHNATAILRTCDAMGVHTCVVVAGRNGFKVNPQISQGVHRYLDLRVVPDIDAAIAALRPAGFRFWVTDLAAGAAVGPAQLLPELAVAPLAIVFGNEGHGISDRARSLADGAFLLPMAGFTQSLNLSVSVAMSLQALRGGTVAADAPGDLAAEVQTACYDRWVRAYCGEAAPGPAPVAGTDRHGAAVEEFRA